VAKDRTVVLDGRLYEAPVSLIGQQVELLFHPQDPECVEIKFQQQSHGILRLVNLAVNCRLNAIKTPKSKSMPPYAQAENSSKGDML